MLSPDGFHKSAVRKRNRGKKGKLCTLCTEFGFCTDCLKHKTEKEFTKTHWSHRTSSGCICIDCQTIRKSWECTVCHVKKPSDSFLKEDFYDRKRIRIVCTDCSQQK